MHQVIAASRAVYEQNFVANAIRSPKTFFRYIREGTKNRDLTLGLRRKNGSIETNDEEKPKVPSPG